MPITKQTLFIFTLFLCTSLAWANNKITSTEALSVIEALVASEPEQALISIGQLKNSNVQLTPVQSVMLIKHEAIANTYLNRHMLALEIIEQVKEEVDFDSDKSFLWHYYVPKHLFLGIWIILKTP